MEKQNKIYEKKQNYLEDMSQLVAEMDRLKIEPEECNVSCPPFGCPQESCPAMYYDNRICNPHDSEISQAPQQHTRLPSLPNKLEECLENFNHLSTSTSPDICAARNLSCNAAEVIQIHYHPTAPQPIRETSVIEILEDDDYTPRLNYYCKRK